MNMREFMRYHLFKTLMILVAIQIGIVAIVQNYNHRPNAFSDQMTMIEGRTAEIMPLVNDSDKDVEDEIKIASFTKPLHGAVRQKGNVLFYTPQMGFFGKDSFTYVVSDGNKMSKSAYVSVVVKENMKPVTTADLAEVYCGGEIVVDVLKNDKDNEGDSIFIKGYSQPKQGNIRFVGNAFIYTSRSSTPITDKFVYVVNDGKNNSDSTLVTVSVLGKSHPCYPWLSTDVGDVAKPGTSSCINNVFTMEASGSDIWNNSDGFRYVWQHVSGDCEMVARVDRLEGTNEWAKAGLMIRESLEAGSACAYICVTGKNGINTHYRPGTAAGMEGGGGVSGVAAPFWVKLIRRGNAFSCFASADGKKWESAGSRDVSMNKAVYIGFAVTSHNNDEMCKVVFSHYRLSQ